ncbi:MAG: hypothetical protein II247_00895 [Lachnospiraceae bacterium]|nr:hypothetical protein [Lachnospiraceae bacterium]
MAMRITTKMMQNTSLRNLNTNKAREQQLTTQMATGKKIARPSDDPVVAIRALRLNSSLDKIDQYYEKNTADAENWLDLTASAISTVNDILANDIRKNINQAGNSELEYKDRQAIIENLTNAVKEIYSIGNADSAGRSLFTGYRTDMPLTFKEDKSETYTITQQLTNLDIDKTTFVETGALRDINEGNFSTISYSAYDVKTNDVYRIRLGYSDIDMKETMANGTASYSSNITIGYMKGTEVISNENDPKYGCAKIATGTTTAYVRMDVKGASDKATVSVVGYGSVTVEKGKKATIGITTGSVSALTVEFSDDGTIKIINPNEDPDSTVTLGYTKTTDENGKPVAEFDKKYQTTLKINGFYPTAQNDDAYKSVIGKDNENNISLIADTGELLLGSAVQEKLSKLSADTELRITYDKSEWKKGDLDPVHYFYTEKAAADNPLRKVKYNENFLDDPTADGKQIIEYDIGNNQSLRVNTTADEFYSHDMIRDVDEVVSMLEEYGTLDDNYKTVKNMIDSEKYTGDELTKLNQQLEALEKAKTMVHDKINKRCEALLTDCDKYIEKTTLAETNCGARGTRLTLVKNRLKAQQTNFQELVSENEDADYTDLTIQLKSVQLTYEAALSSISYVLQTSLLDFVR